MTTFDLHTHHRHRNNAVINLARGEEPEAGYSYSAGLHPWDSGLPDDEIEAQLNEIYRLAMLPEVVAIGEAGLDKLRGASLERQAEILERQASISEHTGKPLILHVVKAYPEIIALKRRLKPRGQWIVHGFRGKPDLARQLVREGFCISLGEHFNAATAEAIPPGVLFAETDESSLPINEIAARLPVTPLGTLHRPTTPFTANL